MTTCLQVERALVLQPPPVACHAADFLAVVVWRWVCEGGDGGVDAVALDAVEEGGVFLLDVSFHCPFILRDSYASMAPLLRGEMTYPRKLSNHTSIRQIEHLVAENRPNQPSRSQHANGTQSHQHHRVEAAKLLRQHGIVPIVDHVRESVVRHAHSAGAAARLPDAPARPAQREEVIPCERF